MSTTGDHISHVVAGNRVPWVFGESTAPILTVYHDGITETFALSRGDDGNWTAQFDTSEVMDNIVYWDVRSVATGGFSTGTSTWCTAASPPGGAQAPRSFSSARHDRPSSRK
jgi:hypothetical protein